MALRPELLLALGAWCEQAATRGASALPELLSDRPVVVIGHVIRDGVVRGQGPELRQSVDLETEEIRAGGMAIKAVFGVRVSVYTNWRRAGEGDARNTIRPLTYGERLRFSATLRRPRAFRNPGAANYPEYLAKQGVVATASVGAPDLEVLPGSAGGRWGSWRSRARRSVLGKIAILWAPEQAALFDAMLIGERALIDRETNTAWQRTGLYHLLVVSSMTVGFLAFFVLWVVRRLRGGEISATALALLVSAAYAYLTDMGAPVMRAVLMLAVYLTTRMFYRNRALLNSLGMAALILLALDPRALFDASFQLSFFCVLALSGLALPILERTSEIYRRGLRNLWEVGYDFVLPPRVAQCRLDLRLLASHLGALLPLAPEAGRRACGLLLRALTGALLFLYDAVVLAVVTQVSMILPMAAYFHRATLVGVPANLLGVTLTGVLMPASATALAFAYLWMPLARLPALLASWSLSMIAWSVKWLGQVYLAGLRLPSPSLVRGVAVLTALAVAMVLIRRKAWQAVSGLVLLAAATSWLTLSPAPRQLTPGVLEVTAIDVGQAESTLLVTPQGRTILVDAAGSLGPWASNLDFGEDVISPYLWSRGLTHLDAVVLTHAHSDHIGGMHSVIANFRPREFWLGAIPETPALREVQNDIRSVGGRVVGRATGDRFEFGGAQFTVLAPPAGWRPTSVPHNNDSMVLLVRFGQTSALLTGDIEKKVEKEIALQPLRADLLKVAHNGSATSTTPELLASVQPRFAVIFAGVDNKFGHPRREVLERLANGQVSTYRTDTMGAVSFILDGHSVMPRVLSAAGQAR